MVQLLELFSHTNSSIDEKCKVGVEVGEMAQFRINLVKNARMKIALHVVLAKLVSVVHSEQTLLAVG
jgi:hypothetical protein